MITGRLRDLEAVPPTGTLRHIEVAFTGSGQARSIIQTIQAAGYTVLANEFSTDPNHLKKGFFVFSGAKGTESEAFFVQDAVRQSFGGDVPMNGQLTSYVQRKRPDLPLLVTSGE